jgi:hypothetical protein
MLVIPIGPSHSEAETAEKLENENVAARITALEIDLRRCSFMTGILQKLQEQYFSSLVVETWVDLHVGRLADSVSLPELFVPAKWRSDKDR